MGKRRKRPKGQGRSHGPQGLGAPRARQAAIIKPLPWAERLLPLGLAALMAPLALVQALHWWDPVSGVESALQGRGSAANRALSRPDLLRHIETEALLGLVFLSLLIGGLVAAWVWMNFPRRSPHPRWLQKAP